MKIKLIFFKFYMIPSIFYPKFYIKNKVMKIKSIKIFYKKINIFAEIKNIFKALTKQ